MENLREYTGPRPGCFYCKEAIDPDGDYVRLQWLGRTWDTGQNLHVECLKPAVAEMPGDTQAPAEGAS